MEENRREQGIWFLLNVENAFAEDESTWLAAAASTMFGIVMDLLWFRFRFKLAVLDGGMGGGGRNCTVPEFISLPRG